MTSLAECVEHIKVSRAWSSKVIAPGNNKAYRYIFLFGSHVGVIVTLLHMGGEEGWA